MLRLFVPFRFASPKSFPKERTSMLNGYTNKAPLLWRGVGVRRNDAYIYPINTIQIMKRFYPIITAFILAFAVSKVKAQSVNGGFSALIQSGPADATKLVNAYGEPLFKGIGVGLNSGWY